MAKIVGVERDMVARAVVPGLAATALAFVFGYVFAGSNEAWSAALGVLVAVANFCAAAVALGWAAGESLPMVQLVVLGGFIVRLGIIIGLMFLLSTMSWFSAAAFGLAVAPATLLLFVYEAIVVSRSTHLVIEPRDSAPAGRSGS
ncbi:MAG TPA: hypothetical protein VGH10_03260 [Actinomycetota bacterium]|jgi:chromate transport protein ChrA